MAYVNYVREINAFHRFANINCLSSSERLLWFGLMDYINQTYASGADWPGEFISVPNKALLSHVPFGEDALIDARNRLKQRGLIEYNPGKKNQKAPEYRMHYFDASELSTGCQQNVDGFCTDKTGNVPCNVPGKVPGNVPVNVPGNVPGNVPDINPNVYPYRNQNAYADDDDAAAADQRARERMEACVMETFRSEMGREALPAEVRKITMVAINCGADPELVVQAIGQSAGMHARNPAAYAIEVIRRWSKKGIHTIYDLVGCVEM